MEVFRISLKIIKTFHQIKIKNLIIILTLQIIKFNNQMYLLIILIKMILNNLNKQINNFNHNNKINNINHNLLNKKYINNNNLIRLILCNKIKLLIILLMIFLISLKNHWIKILIINNNRIKFNLYLFNKINRILLN